MNVQLDIIGTNARHDIDGDHYERVCLVTDVRHRNRLGAVRWAPGIPRVGHRHPENNDAIAQSVRITPTGRDSKSYEVVVSYSTVRPEATSDRLSLNDPVEVRTDIRTIADTTILDRLGNKMEVYYSRNVLSLIRSVQRVELERPGSIISITKTTRTAPHILTNTYGGHCNSNRWSGYGRYEVLCEGFEGTGQRGSNLWRVTGRFYPSPLESRTWHTPLYANNDDNVIPTDAAPGNGIEQYEVYPIADFGVSGFVL